MSRIVIIGGGISGLACARFLLDRASDLDVVVLEASERVGGTIATHRADGFTCEAGPNGFLNRHPSTLALALRVGLADELVTGCEQVRRRFVLDRGRLRRFPDSVGTFLSTDLMSWRAKARMALEPLVRRRRQGSVDESVGQFARRRLGRGAAELLVDPVVSGIYAGSMERLSLRSTLPQLAALEERGDSLLGAYVRSRQQPDDGVGLSPTAVGSRRLVSFAGGTGRLVEATAASLGARVRLHSPVRSVEREGARFRVLTSGARPDELLADAVVCAAPAPAAAGFLRPLDAALATACERIPHAPVAMVALGHREADVPHPLDGFGYLPTSRHGGPVLGVLWSTSIFPGHRSLPGRVLLQAILWGVREPGVMDESDDCLVERAGSQIEATLGITAAPLLARVFRHRPGLPQYDVGHGRVLAEVEAACSRQPGLFVTGNSFRGVGTNSCTADAERVADQLACHFGLDTAPAPPVTRHAPV